MMAGCGTRKKECPVRVLLGIGCLGLVLAGCVSGGGEFQWRYHEQYTRSEKNRQAMRDLRAGMSTQEVRAIMGEPQMVEVYPRGTVWYYRTATTGLESSTALDTTATQRTARNPESPGGPGGGADPGFSPVVFDERERLVGWGQDAQLQDLRVPQSPEPARP
jgi:SmpA / OmlA family